MKYVTQVHERSAKLVIFCIWKISQASYVAKIFVFLSDLEQEVYNNIPTS